MKKNENIRKSCCNYIKIQENLKSGLFELQSQNPTLLVMSVTKKFCRPKTYKILAYTIHTFSLIFYKFVVSFT